MGSREGMDNPIATPCDASDTTNPTVLDESDDNDDDELLYLQDDGERKGLETGLRDRSYNMDEWEEASMDVENFLGEVDRTLMKVLEDAHKKDPRKQTERDKMVRNMLSKLGDCPNTVVIPTDKTNSYEVISRDDYI